MQERHRNRKRYFEELAATSERYFIPYIRQWHAINAYTEILEIGCGEGGNLLPFVRMGCNVTGIDISETRIHEARTFFGQAGAKGEFTTLDFFRLNESNRKYDVILCHDVFEHIGDKETFLERLPRFLKAQGVVFIAFPAWQMPFGGHQQICRSPIASRLPFIHLLPLRLYQSLLRLLGEEGNCIRELMEIKETRVTVEAFERLIEKSNLRITDRQLWLINPHYEIKFGLSSRRLNSLIAQIPYVRNFVASACFYMLAVDGQSPRNKKVTSVMQYL